MFRAILDLIYPVRCPICGEIILPRNSSACSICKDKLVYIKEPRCKQCSKPIEIVEKEFCNDCDSKSYHYKSGISLWVYNDLIKQSISDFKYHNKRENSEFYIKEMLKAYGNTIKKMAPDIIVPIPIHWSKFLDRGYNQADILAKGLSKSLDIPVLSNLLIRNKNTLPQKQLSDKERLHNLQEAFSINQKVFGNLNQKVRTVLLVDDIYTTGSTIEACTNVLLKQGFDTVYFITLCIGKGY